MKALANPPAGVFTVAQVVMILLGEKISMNDPLDKVWKKAQAVMNNPPQFIERVKSFKGEEIDPNVLVPVQQVINDPGKNFNQKSMTGQSQAAGFLCGWVVNIVIFNKIFKEVKPLVDSRDKAT